VVRGESASQRVGRSASQPVFAGLETRTTAGLETGATGLEAGRYSFSVRAGVAAVQCM
jgi:hypothetical protein